MNGPQRWFAGTNAELVPDDEGPAVLFSDVEEALRDSKRLHWLMPVLTGQDDSTANLRTQALAAGLTLGKTGIDLVDYAMEGCTA